MKNEDFEFLLFDRITKIQAINKQYDLEHNAYIAFSGGKDSTILHYLIDLALPNNNIPRVFLNTGMEYTLMLKYVKKMVLNDKRIIILNSSVKIKNMLKKYGYPFKSKEHSQYVACFQNNHNNKTISRYLHPAEKRKSYGCPKKLRYQFTDDFNLKISDKCCYKLKKEPSQKWAKQHNKSIKLTGMRKSEGGNRINLSCISGKKIHFLAVVSDEWENMFIKKYNIKLCDLYYAPYNFKRTGCKGCPYSLDLQEQLDLMRVLLPHEYKQSWYLWRPVYKEYRRIGYRLEPRNLFNLEDEEK